MLKRIKKKEEFLYDVPFTTGSKPTRGLYTLVWLEDGTPVWEQNGKLIANPNWTIILNSAWQNLHFSIHKPSKEGSQDKVVGTNIHDVYKNWKYRRVLNNEDMRYIQNFFNHIQSQYKLIKK